MIDLLNWTESAEIVQKLGSRVNPLSQIARRLSNARGDATANLCKKTLQLLFWEPRAERREKRGEERQISPRKERFRIRSDVVNRSGLSDPPIPALSPGFDKPVALQRRQMGPNSVIGQAEGFRELVCRHPTLP
jgi:hypothetical protein